MINLNFLSHFYKNVIDSSLIISNQKWKSWNHQSIDSQLEFLQSGCHFIGFKHFHLILLRSENLMFSFTKCDFWSVNFLKLCVFGLICQLTNVGTYLFWSSDWPVSVLKYHIITHSHTSSYYLLLVKDTIVLGCDQSK